MHTDGDNAAAADSLISAQPKRDQRHSHQQLDNYPRGPVLSLNHLDFVSTIGKGGFGRVFLVRPKANNPVGLSPEKCLALKTIKKSRLASNK